MLTKLYASIFTNWNEVPTTLFYCLLIIFLYLKYKQRNELKLASFAHKLQQKSIKLLPSPPAMPIIGHIHLLRDHQHNPWDGFEEIRKKFGQMVSLKMGVHPMILVSSSEAMREILLKKGDIFSNRPNFPRHHIIFGGDKENSLALCNWSNTHRDRRKLCKRGIVPNKFSSRNQLLESIISKFVVEFVDNISNQRPMQQQQYWSGTPVYNNDDFKQTIASQQDNLYFKTTKEDLLFLTSDIFMEFLCSERFSHLDSQYKEFVQGCDFVFWDINQSYLIDFLPFLTSLGLGYTYLKKLKRVTDFLRDYIDDKIFVPRHERHLVHGSNDGRLLEGLSAATDGGEDANEDYLDSIILEYMSKTTSMSLADYKVGFADLLAGHAAVANILIRLLGHLALNQDIQDMICKESQGVDIYNLKHKPHLPVTEAAMQEALRVASSPIVPHVAREDTSIDDFYVPKGSMVLFNNYHLNLSETLWTNPHEFDPMRFLDVKDDANGVRSYKLNVPKHFMPFSVGMRQCLGYKMVETTTIVTVANLCSKFIIAANDENLVRKLVAPKGSVALDPEAECFELKLFPRGIQS